MGTGAAGKPVEPKVPGPPVGKVVVVVPLTGASKLIMLEIESGSVLYSRVL